MRPIEPAPVHPLKFEKRFDFNKDGSVRKESVWVTWAKKGVSIPMETTDKVERAKRRPELWAAIEPHYNAWLAGTQEQIVVGTPLAAWPGMEPHVRDLLKSKKIFSVEEFANISDTMVQQLGFPGAREMRDKAKAFVNANSQASEMEALRAKIAELEAEKNAESDKPKRGPGRPRKDETASSEDAA